MAPFFKGNDKSSTQIQCTLNNGPTSEMWCGFKCHECNIWFASIKANDTFDWKWNERRFQRTLSVRYANSRHVMCGTHFPRQQMSATYIFPPYNYVTSKLVDIFDTICAHWLEIMLQFQKQKNPLMCMAHVLSIIANGWGSILISKNVWSMPIFDVLECNNNYECYQRVKSPRRKWRNECRYYDICYYILKITLAAWIFMFLFEKRDSAKTPGHHCAKRNTFILFDGCIMGCPMLFGWSHLFLSHEIIAIHGR